EMRGGEVAVGVVDGCFNLQQQKARTLAIHMTLARDSPGNSFAARTVIFAEERPHWRRGAEGDRRMTTKVSQRENSDGMSQSRYSDLKQMLDERRREIQAEVQGKMRDVRQAGEVGKLNDVFDAVESSEADIQEDIEFAL